jgi:predicted RNase H-like HicB family nuclease
MPTTYTAVIARAETGGYVAYCLEVPAVGQGATLEACRATLCAAIQLMVEDRRAVERQKAPPGAWEERLEVQDAPPRPLAPPSWPQTCPHCGCPQGVEPPRRTPGQWYCRLCHQEFAAGTAAPG